MPYFKPQGVDTGLRVRGPVRGLFLVLAAAGLGAILLGGAVFAQVTPRAQTGSGRVDVLFEPLACGSYPCTITYQVYRNGRTAETEREFEPAGTVTVERPADSVDWTTVSSTVYDAVYDSFTTVQPDTNSSRYLVFRDRGDITDDEEYYYLVTDAEGGTPAGVGQVQDHAVVSAFPPGQTRHGDYTEFTGACTACHGLHSTPSHQNLLKGTTATALCYTCHDGTGSKYDVVNGLVSVSDTVYSTTESFGGPFGRFASPSATTESTSAHSVEAGVLVRRAPGSGTPPLNEAWNSHFTCISCHDPHNSRRNFRSLRGAINGQTVKVRAFTAVRWTEPDQSDAAAVSVYIYGVNEFCGACHVYFNDQQTGSVARSVAGVAGTHRHPVGITPAGYADVTYDRMSWEYDRTGLAFEDARPLETTLPLEGSQTGAQYNQNVMVCLTCHNAHGTTHGGLNDVAYQNGDANGTEGADTDDTGYTSRDAALAGRVGSSVLKRLPNTSICQDCHQK